MSAAAGSSTWSPRRPMRSACVFGIPREHHRVGHVVAPNPGGFRLETPATARRGRPLLPVGVALWESAAQRMGCSRTAALVASARGRDGVRREPAWLVGGGGARRECGGGGEEPGCSGKLSAGQGGSLNLCPFAHQRSRGAVMAADRWWYELSDSYGLPGRPQRTAKRTPVYSSVQGVAPEPAVHDPLRLHGQI